MNDAPLTRPKHSSPPSPATMTSEDVIRELAEALRDSIVETDDRYLEANPESAYVDLACRLIFRMKTITVVPARGERKAEIDREFADAAVRTFETLDRWLREGDPGARTLETAVDRNGRFELTLTELTFIDLPGIGRRTVPEIKGFFQGGSLQDAYAQAATAIVCNGGDL